MEQTLRGALLVQKEEVREFLQEVRSGKFFSRKLEERKDYFFSTNLMKIVLGPRRAGKSVFLFRLLQDVNFAYFNFENFEIRKEDFSVYVFLKLLKEVYGDFKCIYFDEIQNLPLWETVLNELHRHNYNIFVTGSNASLLSKELATALTGRHLPIQIMPFSATEILAAQDSPDKKFLAHSTTEILRKYLVNGGFPAIAFSNIDPREYMGVLYDSVVYKDMVKRYKLRNLEQINSIGNYFLSNIGSLYQAKKLFKKLDLKSDHTLEKYILLFEDAYILATLQRYSFKSSSRISSPRKVYTFDNGYIQGVGILHSENHGKLLENLVFVELVKQGLKPNRNFFYYNTKTGKEVDFIVKNPLSVEGLIQVCFDLSNLETEERETSALVQASKELSCDDLTIITWADEKEMVVKGKKIKVIPFHKYFTEPLDFSTLP